MEWIEYVTCLGDGATNNVNANCNINSGEEIYATASYDSTVRLWDARSRSKEPLMILDQANDAVTCVAGGRGVAQIITSSVDGKVGSLVLSIAPFIVGLFLFINFLSML